MRRRSSCRRISCRHRCCPTVAVVAFVAFVAFVALDVAQPLIRDTLTHTSVLGQNSQPPIQSQRGRQRRRSETDTDAAATQPTDDEDGNDDDDGATESVGAFAALGATCEYLVASGKQHIQSEERRLHRGEFHVGGFGKSGQFWMCVFSE